MPNLDDLLDNNGQPLPSSDLPLSHARRLAAQQAYAEQYRIPAGAQPVGYAIETTRDAQGQLTYRVVVDGAATTDQAAVEISRAWRLMPPADLQNAMNALERANPELFNQVNLLFQTARATALTNPERPSEQDGEDLAVYWLGLDQVNRSRAMQVVQRENETLYVMARSRMEAYRQMYPDEVGRYWMQLSQTGKTEQLRRLIDQARIDFSPDRFQAAQRQLRELEQRYAREAYLNPPPAPAQRTGRISTFQEMIQQLRNAAVSQRTQEQAAAQSPPVTLGQPTNLNRQALLDMIGGTGLAQLEAEQATQAQGQATRNEIAELMRNMQSSAMLTDPARLLNQPLGQGQAGYPNSLRSQLLTQSQYGRAESIVNALALLPSEDRFVRLEALRATDPVVHALVVAELNRRSPGGNPTSRTTYEQALTLSNYGFITNAAARRFLGKPLAEQATMSLTAADRLSAEATQTEQLEQYVTAEELNEQMHREAQAQNHPIYGYWHATNNGLHFQIMGEKRVAKAWNFRSDSNPDKMYQTRLYDDRSLSCNCPGWTRRRERICRHTTMVLGGTADQCCDGSPVVYIAGVTPAQPGEGRTEPGRATLAAAVSQAAPAAPAAAPKLTESLGHTVKRRTRTIK